MNRTISNVKTVLTRLKYLTDSYIVFTLKMISVSKTTIFSLKMMVKSGLKNIFEIPPFYFILLRSFSHNLKFSTKNNHLPAWRDFKINFCRPFFTIIFRTKIVILDPDFNLRVKTMHESVK